MITILHIYIALLAAALLLSVAYVVIQSLAIRRRADNQKKITDKYLESLYHWIYTDHINRDSFSRLIHSKSRRLQTELMANIARLSYGYINARMERLIRWRHMDRMLIRRARERRGYARARTLRVLSLLPLTDSAVSAVGSFENDVNRHVRLYALLVMINHKPDRVIETISACKRPLANLELAHVALLLRRRFVPASIYVELLSSFDRNLQMLGLHIVRLYRIELAEPMVVKLIPTLDKVLRNAVLHTLVTIRAPISQRRTVQAVTLMGERGRKRFYRLAAVEGYSLQALQPYAQMEGDAYLGCYLNHAVNSRKHKLYPVMSLN